jgi:septum formation protein
MLILASQSPRRKELLERAGISFEVRTAGVAEERRPGESAEDYVLRLSREKAEAIGAPNGAWVLGADTVVVLGDEMLEKPRDPADAGRMLTLLSGREHQVLTGICLKGPGGIGNHVERTRVWFAPLSAKEIAEYVASGEPMDKAGAYAIQGLGSKFITRIEGCYFNVVGLPVSLVYRMLLEQGYSF